MPAAVLLKKTLPATASSLSNAIGGAWLVTVTVSLTLPTASTADMVARSRGLQGEAAGENNESGRRDLGLIESGWKTGEAETPGCISVSSAGFIVGEQAERNGGPWNVGPAGIGDSSGNLGESVERASIVFHLEVKRAVLAGRTLCWLTTLPERSSR